MEFNPAVKIFSKRYHLRSLSWRPGALAKNTFLITGGLSLRAFLQFVLFVGLARSLGVLEYGKFIAVLAMMTFMVPLVGFGMPTLLVKKMAIDRARYAQQFGKSLIVVGICALICLAVALMAGDWLLPKEINRNIVFNIALAELFFGSIIDLSSNAFKAIEQFIYFIMIRSGLILLRLISFGVMMMVVGHIDASSWSICYLLATALTMVFALGIVFKKIGLPHLTFKGFFTTMSEGSYYALAGASSRINGEIDKLFLARLTSLGMTGAYSAAYRFTDIVMLPVNALLGASSARFFREGSKGMTSSITYAKKILPLPVTYACLGGLLLFFGADVIPLLIGSEYIIAVPMLKWLAILPLMLLLRSFFSMIVVAGGHPRYNGIVYLAGALTNIGLNFCLIPLFGWSGAALATIIAEIVMILSFWVIIRSEFSQV